MHTDEIHQAELQRACNIFEQLASDIGRSEAVVSIRIRQENEGGGVDIFLKVEPSVYSDVNLSPHFEILDHHDLSVSEQLLKQVEKTAETWKQLAENLGKALKPFILHRAS